MSASAFLTASGQQSSDAVCEHPRGEGRQEVGVDATLEAGRLVLAIAGQTQSAPNNLEIRVDGGLLRLSGEICRTFVLPPQVDIDKVEASLREGRVVVIMPLRPRESEPVRLEVETPPEWESAAPDWKESCPFERRSQVHRDRLARREAASRARAFLHEKGKNDNGDHTLDAS